MAEKAEGAVVAENVHVVGAIDQLRAAGLRITGSRLAVVEALQAMGGHPSADEVCAHIQKHRPAVHRATVYRTLETLAEIGLVTHVHLSSGVAAYHLTTSVPEPDHVHASCRVCARIVDLPADLLEPIRENLRALSGFDLEPAHVALSGICQSCQTSRGDL